MISNPQRYTPTPKYSEVEKSSSSRVFEQKKSHLPSVPIYIYRQIAEDLATTKAELETLKSQNKKLIAQNQQLKKEVTKIVASTHNLQEILQQEVKSNTPRINSGTPEHNSGRNSSSISKQILELEYNQPYSVKKLNKKARIDVFWLIIAIIVISLTFSVGSFFVAKLLLNNNN